MLSYLFTGLIMISMVFAWTGGSPSALSGAAMSGAANAITLGISLAGPLCLWCGVGELMGRTGLREKLGKLLFPVLRRLFPRLQSQNEGFSALSFNVTANLLGLGNAATPMGIKACQAMGDGSGRATKEQCRLIVMNTASIQLLPTTVAALRAGLGSKTPLDILPAVLLSSLFSISAGLLACRLLERGHD